MLPDFDYEQYERRQAEWEASLDENGNPPPKPEAPAEDIAKSSEPSSENEEDMSW